MCYTMHSSMDSGNNDNSDGHMSVDGDDSSVSASDDGESAQQQRVEGGRRGIRCQGRG